MTGNSAGRESTAALWLLVRAGGTYGAYTLRVVVRPDRNVGGGAACTKCWFEEKGSTAATAAEVEGGAGGAEAGACIVCLWSVSSCTASPGSKKSAGARRWVGGDGAASAAAERAAAAAGERRGRVGGGSVGGESMVPCVRAPVLGVTRALLMLMWVGAARGGH